MESLRKWVSATAVDFERLDTGDLNGILDWLLQGQLAENRPRNVPGNGQQPPRHKSTDIDQLRAAILAQLETTSIERLVFSAFVCGAEREWICARVAAKGGEYQEVLIAEQERRDMEIETLIRQWQRYLDVLGGSYPTQHDQLGKRHYEADMVWRNEIPPQYHRGGIIDKWVDEAVNGNVESEEFSNEARMLLSAAVVARATVRLNLIYREIGKEFVR